MKKVVFLIFLGFVVVCCKQASASIITINFSGTGVVTEKKDISLEPWKGVSEIVGDPLPLSGTISYDTNIQAWADSPPYLSQYWPKEYQFTLGDYEWKSQAYLGTGIIIIDRPEYDMFRIQEEGLLFKEGLKMYSDYSNESNFYMIESSNFLSSTDLPSAEELLAYRGSANLDFMIIGDNLSNLVKVEAKNLSYTVSTSPVPIPGAIWLLGSGLFGLIFVRKKN